MNLQSISDIGTKRKDNQDNYWCAIANVDGSDCGVVCVCDGMGGLNNGGLASKIVVEAVKDGFKSGVPFRELEGVLQDANSVIYNKSNNVTNGKMGTTCTLLEVMNGRYKILHIGDSRCYRISKRGGFDVLTVDHSALRQYDLSPEKDYNMWMKYKNSLTRCIGVKPRIKVDYREGSYNKGDKFLVCSDGMWHLFEKSCFHMEDLNDLRQLVNKAIREGELDNITCCTISL